MTGLESNSIYLIRFERYIPGDGNVYMNLPYLVGILKNDESKSFEITPEYTVRKFL